MFFIGNMRADSKTNGEKVASDAVNIRKMSEQSTKTSDMAWLFFQGNSHKKRQKMTSLDANLTEVSHFAASPNFKPLDKRLQLFSHRPIAHNQKAALP